MGLLSVQQIEHRPAEKRLPAKKERELDAIVGEIEAQIEEVQAGRVVDNETAQHGAVVGFHLGRGLLAVHRKAASVIREMDGFRTAGLSGILHPQHEREKRLGSTGVPTLRPSCTNWPNLILAGGRWAATACSSLRWRHLNRASA